MHSARVKFQIAPSRSDVITFSIGTIISEENERFFHHVLRLEKDSKFAVLVRDRMGRVGRKVGVGRGGKYHRRLGLLSGDGGGSRLGVNTGEERTKKREREGLTLQNVHSSFLYNARNRSAHTWHVRWLHADKE